ncbi:MAG: hypothetical protein ACI841_002282 [Planctomycetota bacterium]|jgi:hypothetical protein
MQANPDPSNQTQPSGRERRQHTRAQAEWPIMIELEDGPHEARIRDISQAGVCFFLDRPVAEMTALRIELDVPGAQGQRRIRGAGAVVRCEKISAALEHYEVAVYLQEMSEPDREWISAFVTTVE